MKISFKLKPKYFKVIREERSRFHVHFSENLRIDITVTFIKSFARDFSRVPSQLRKQRDSSEVGCQHHLKTNINLVPKISKSLIPYIYLKRGTLYGKHVSRNSICKLRQF